MSEQAGKQKINAYKRINLFLQKFLLHGNADIKYQIASKGFLEQTLDMEFRQVIQDTDPCVLYRGKPNQGSTDRKFGPRVPSDPVRSWWSADPQALFQHESALSFS